MRCCIDWLEPAIEEFRATHDLQRRGDPSWWEFWMKHVHWQPFAYRENCKKVKPHAQCFLRMPTRHELTTLSAPGTNVIRLTEQKKHNGYRANVYTRDGLQIFLNVVADRIERHLAGQLHQLSGEGHH